ncbi:MAG: protein-L-isoaspartate(D-aspartate) O-methyltransferase [Verrucomicrobia bacterium]|nr:protein-L-isoaspartate(D-aspartate) O-methyltransferase [Verrucomicrobiota bacterium]
MNSRLFKSCPLLVVALAGCGGPQVQTGLPLAGGDSREALREAMVRDQIEARGVKDPEVLVAMRRVPRHEFVPERLRDHAYNDHPLPIGEDQTISQPYIVAFMTEALRLKRGQRVLEIGTGSGYQAAVLAELGVEVYTIEIIPSLAERARATLARLNYKSVQVRAGDGYLGWPEAAPFDGIIVTAAPPRVPRPLIDQLKPGARLVVPEGVAEQDLVIYTKAADGQLRREAVLPVRFVPMTGRAQESLKR